MYCTRVGRNGEQGAHEVKVYTKDSCAGRAPSKLPQLLGVWYAEHANDGALVRSGGKHSACRVESEGSDGRLVRLNDIESGERDGVKEENVTGRGSWWWRRDSGRRKRC